MANAGDSPTTPTTTWGPQSAWLDGYYLRSRDPEGEGDQTMMVKENMGEEREEVQGGQIIHRNGAGDTSVSHTDPTDLYYGGPVKTPPGIMIPDSPQGGPGRIPPGITGNPTGNPQTLDVPGLRGVLPPLIIRKIIAITAGQICNFQTSKQNG